MHNLELETLLNHELKSESIHDYAPNGIQVEGKAEVKTIITGVTACQALLDEAVKINADAIIVHHGYFWKGESYVVKGMKRNRLKTLLEHDINLYAYHLPLDLHPVLGNNACLGQMLNINLLGTLAPENPNALIHYGEYSEPKTNVQVKAQLEELFGRKVLHCGYDNPRGIKRLAWASGGAQDYFEEAAEKGVDAFFTGEVSERTVHIAREMKIDFYAAGHHATERYGIKALGEWLSKNHNFDVTFIDIDNPV